MGLYDGWRKDGGPTLYGSLKTPVTADVLEAGFLFSAAILAFSLLLALPGVRGLQVHIARMIICMMIVVKV